MAHLKRSKTPKNWPIPRKGTTFVVRPASNISKGLPILLLLRDVLKVAQNKKEVKKAIHENLILINTKHAKDVRQGLTLFDTVTIVPSKKNYRIVLSEKGKYGIEEIKEKDAERKVAKVINKKILKGKKMQLNLSDGQNFNSDIKCNSNDSIVIDLKNKKIEKCLPLQEKAKVFVFAGKHAGKKGAIKKLKLERQMASIDAQGKNINVLIKQLIVTD